MRGVAQAFCDVSARIAHAAKRSDRDPSDICLVAVSKGMPREVVNEAIAAGIEVFGENRVQEAVDKFSDQKGGCALHLIGSLQTNKVSKAVGFFDLIHSVDSIRLAEMISKEAVRRSIVQPVLVQVNVGDETTKGGVSVSDAPWLVEAMRQLSGLKLLGLMAIPPRVSDPESARPYFAALRKLGLSLGLYQFSIGMSGDFEVAIEEGATWVRIGTALFGLRG